MWDGDERDPKELVHETGGAGKFPVGRAGCSLQPWGKDWCWHCCLNLEASGANFPSSVSSPKASR